MEEVIEEERRKKRKRIGRRCEIGETLPWKGKTIGSTTIYENETGEGNENRRKTNGERRLVGKDADGRRTNGKRRSECGDGDKDGRKTNK